MTLSSIRARAAATGCYDCGLSYSDPGFADLVVSDDVWLKISPTGHGGGLLCPTCLVRRADKAGIEKGRAVFRSGPFADFDRDAELSRLTAENKAMREALKRARDALEVACVIHPFPGDKHAEISEAGNCPACEGMDELRRIDTALSAAGD